MPEVSIAEPLLTPAVSLSPRGTTWRPLNRALWVGRSEVGPVGTIERGRRYVASDGEGHFRGAYRSLDAAMAAFEQRGQVEDPQERLAWDPLVLVTALAGSASVLLALYALLGV